MLAAAAEAQRLPPAPEHRVPSKRRSDHPGVIVHESRDIAYVPPVFIDGIPCTPPRRLAVDIGAVLGPTEYATVLRDLRRDLGITWEQLAGVLRLHSRKGRDGCGPLRHQLERTYGIEGIPETTLEQMVLDLLIERALGWTVERFDEEAVTYHPESVLRAVRVLLVERGVDVSPVPPRLPDLRRVRPIPGSSVTTARSCSGTTARTGGVGQARTARATRSVPKAVRMAR